jgi:MarR family transcriptional regulator, organic hydroperoxide resistance regulator
LKDQSKLLLLDQQICFALYRASRSVIRAYTPILKPLGITYVQYLVMLVLWEGDNVSVKEIGERLALDSATLTPLLKKLEKLGLIVRKRFEQDERVVVVQLTKNGIALYKKAESIPVAVTCKGGFNLSQKADVKKIRQLREELVDIAIRYS